MHTFDLNNLNLLRINLIEKPQSEQVNSDLCFLCSWEPGNAACTLACFVLEAEGPPLCAHDKLWLHWARGNPALTGVYSRICFALHRCALSRLWDLDLAHATPALMGTSA